MAAEHDRHFFDTFAMILGALVVFTVIIYFLANAIADRTQVATEASNPLKAQMTESRLKPVGVVAVTGQAAPTVVPASAPAATAMPAPATVAAAMPTNPAPAAASGSADGEAIYNSVCMACHALGVAGAPKFGDKEAWAPYIAKGMDTLYANSINGVQGAAGIMPPKGGRMDLDDSAIKATVDYMVDAAR